MEDKDLASLKEMVAKKLALEKEKKTSLPEYLANNQSINQLLDGLSADKKKFLKAVCKLEYDNYSNFYNSDIEDSQREIMSPKIDIASDCIHLIDEKLINKKTDRLLGK